ncbi:MAG: PLP-dependent aminotransferase family protein [Deltaproteobacteria bacterium]|nr:PLP-dependent aminotransferase family protein [Deltaproteobacteria bacterium]
MKKEYQYSLLAKEMESKIETNIFRPGEKLPSIREMHKTMNKSISTISRAYVLLESNGLIEARDRSGYYVRTAMPFKIKRPEKSKLTLDHKPINRSGILDEVLNSMSDETKIPLGAAFISPRLLPFNNYSSILKNFTKKEIKMAISYNKPQGLFNLRRQVSLRTLGLVDGITPEDIVITNGCTEALVICLMALVKEGDTIALEAPAYYGLFPVLEDMGVFVIEIPTCPENGIDYEALKIVIKSKDIKCCIINSNFHNPLGCIIPEAKKKKIVKLLNNHEVPLIEDDIYSDLYFEKQHPKPLKAFDKKDLVLTCSSFSKTLAPGLRTGWIIPGERYKKKIIKIKSGLSVSTSTLDQYILVKFIENGNYEKHLRTLRNILRRQVNSVAKAIYQYFPKQIRMYIPKGGFLLWVQLPEGVNSIDLYKKALLADIAILPGNICSSTGVFREYIRISCGSPYTDEMEQAIAKIGSFIMDLMKNQPDPVS